MKNHLKRESKAEVEVRERWRKERRIGTRGNNVLGCPATSRTTFKVQACSLVFFTCNQVPLFSVDAIISNEDFPYIFFLSILLLIVININ